MAVSKTVYVSKDISISTVQRALTISLREKSMLFNYNVSPVAFLDNIYNFQLCRIITFLFSFECELKNYRERIFWADNSWRFIVRDNVYVSRFYRR